MSAVDTEELRTRLAALRKLRANGVLRTRFGTDEIQYRSDAELASAIADLDRQLAAAEGRAPSVAFVNFRSNRGW